jgi:hypothetical protein
VIVLAALSQQRKEWGMAGAVLISISAFGAVSKDLVAALQQLRKK